MQDKMVITEILLQMSKLESIESLKFAVRIAMDKAIKVIASKASDRIKKIRILALYKAIPKLDNSKDIKQHLKLMGLTSKEVNATISSMGQIVIGGFTVVETLAANQINTIKRATTEAIGNVFSDEPLDLEDRRKVRQVQTITTAQSIMTGVRGLGRSLQGKNKECARWINIGVSDSRQTKVCRKHKGSIYLVPYRYIKNKPPRRPPVHRCRSFLIPSCGNSGYVPPKNIKELLDRNQEVAGYLKGKGIENPETFKEMQGTLLLSANTIDKLT